MEIKATFFRKIDGTIFVVTRNGSNNAEGVFKTQSSANKLRDKVRAAGGTAEVRVGHFTSETTIQTI